MLLGSLGEASVGSWVGLWGLLRGLLGSGWPPGAPGAGLLGVLLGFLAGPFLDSWGPGAAEALCDALAGFMLGECPGLLLGARAASGVPGRMLVEVPGAPAVWGLALGSFNFIGFIKNYLTSSGFII